MQFIYEALNSIKSNEDLIAYISKGRDLSSYTEITNAYIGKENVEWKIKKRQYYFTHVYYNEIQF